MGLYLLSFLVIDSFVVQLILCFKVKNRWKRSIPTLITALYTVVTTAGFFLSGQGKDAWTSVGWLILALCGALLLACCGLAWVIWLIAKGISYIRKPKVL